MPVPEAMVDGRAVMDPGVSRQSQKCKDFVYDPLSFQNYMDLSKGHIRALHEGDLSSPKGIEACINASEALLQCMNVALRPGVCETSTVRQQKYCILK